MVTRAPSKKVKVSKRGRYARKAPAPKAPIGDTFKATLEFNGLTHTVLGASAMEAFRAFALKPGLLKTKAILRLEVDGMRSEQIFFSLQLRRFLFSSLAKEVWAKRMQMKLKPHG